jgi:hypothetical protein
MARYWHGCFPRDATKVLARAHTHAEQEAIVWPVRGDVLATSIRARARKQRALMDPTQKLQKWQDRIRMSKIHVVSG